MRSAPRGSIRRSNGRSVPTGNRATKFRILNETKFSKLELRGLLARSFGMMREKEGGGLYSRITVRIVPARHRVTGCAGIGGNSMILRLPKTATREDFLWLAVHEINHLYGYHHGQFAYHMPKHWLAELDGAPSTRLVVVVPKPKAKVDLPAKRFASIVARIGTWEAKERRAANALKKLRRQRREYERRLAAGKLS